ncbi:hypothetical protein [Uliginosibacterium sp. H1]|uniref:hypothetical protein n=1 Tax=Uliginosibacterium sp. H1 TaxID=3114757 RepID=UPI002E19A118|nr:hypothetical protein [Uliginosibacterium sp. H1]
MFQQFIRLCAVLVIGLSAGGALAARAVPVGEPAQRAVVQPGNGARTAAQVRDAIVNGGRNLGWQVRSEEPGKIRLGIQVRSHTVVVDVSYHATGYSVAYADSTEMNYRGEGAAALIHPNYHKWVSNLCSQIDRALPV